MSVTLRLDPAVRAAIATIGADAWTKISYPNAVFDEPSQQWILAAEVAEVPYVAFASQKKSHHTPGRPIVRRPQANTAKGQ